MLGLPQSFAVDLAQPPVALDQGGELLLDGQGSRRIVLSAKPSEKRGNSKATDRCETAPTSGMSGVWQMYLTTLTTITTDGSLAVPVKASMDIFHRPGPSESCRSGIGRTHSGGSDG